MPNSRQTNEGADRRYAACRLYPLSQIAFASNRLPAEAFRQDFVLLKSVDCIINSIIFIPL